MEKVIEKISVKLEGKKEFVPLYSSLFAAGADLKAAVDGNFVLKSGERALISTGLKLEIPIGYEGQVRPRSGLAYKYGVTVLNRLSRFKTAGKDAGAGLICTSTNNFHLTGDLKR